MFEAGEPVASGPAGEQLNERHRAAEVALGLVHIMSTIEAVHTHADAMAAARDLWFALIAATQGSLLGDFDSARLANNDSTWHFVYAAHHELLDVAEPIVPPTTPEAHAE
ncbi:MAG: hypothetical protein GEV08_01915 [Acidimicrobiia bacterium]|nr:hypothetical protein [Acidimicrobiia bacterium]